MREQTIQASTKRRLKQREQRCHQHRNRKREGSQHTQRILKLARDRMRGKMQQARKFVGFPWTHRSSTRLWSRPAHEAATDRSPTPVDRSQSTRPSPSLSKAVLFAVLSFLLSLSLSLSLSLYQSLVLFSTCHECDGSCALVGPVLILVPLDLVALPIRPPAKNQAKCSVGSLCVCVLRVMLQALFASWPFFVVADAVPFCDDFVAPAEAKRRSQHANSSVRPSFVH